MVELYDLIVAIASRAVALADPALRSLYDLCAACASNGMDPGPLAGGAAAGGAAGAGAAGGGDGNDRGRSDRGFRYTNGDGTLYDGAGSGSTRVGEAPNGGRLIYDQVNRDGRGNPTHYHVNVPGGPTGWIPAGNTSDTRPGGSAPILHNPDKPLPRPSFVPTAGARG